MSNQPWMKFFPADWRSDPTLRITSLAARGLWIEMLSIMHEASPRGHLVVNGKPVGPETLAMMVGSDTETVKNLINELEENGVFSRKKNGVIFSRRIEKDENKSRKNRENGKLGGNPSLCNKTENEGSDNHEVKAKKLEARYQTKEKPNGFSKNGTFLPTDWVMEKPDLEFAFSAGFTELQAHEIAVKFKLHFASLPDNKARRADWSAAWQSFVLNAPKYRQSTPPKPKNTGYVDYVPVAKRFDPEPIPPPVSHSETEKERVRQLIQKFKRPSAEVTIQ